MTRNFKNPITTVKALPLMAAIALVAIATSTMAPALAQSTAPTASPTRDHKQGGWNQLNLSDTQKAQLKSIREASKAQIDAILTQAQKDQLAAAKGDRQQHRQVWESLNLTADQKASMKQIRDDSQQKMAAILTPTQLQQWKQMRQHHKPHSPTAQPPNP